MAKTFLLALASSLVFSATASAQIFQAPTWSTMQTNYGYGGQPYVPQATWSGKVMGHPGHGYPFHSGCCETRPCRHLWSGFGHRGCGHSKLHGDCGCSSKGVTQKATQKHFAPRHWGGFGLGKGAHCGCGHYGKGSVDCGCGHAKLGHDCGCGHRGLGLRLFGWLHRRHDHGCDSCGAGGMSVPGYGYESGYGGYEMYESGPVLESPPVEMYESGPMLEAPPVDDAPTPAVEAPPEVEV